MKWFLDVLRGMVIGLANVIPGVSGGTMMVSMGIYDKLIYSINNLFKKFRECFKVLLPYLVGMGLAIILGSVALKVAFEDMKVKVFENSTAEVTCDFFYTGDDFDLSVRDARALDATLRKDPESGRWRFARVRLSNIIEK